MGIFSSTKKEKIIAIFDIGSGSIGGAIARLSSDARTAPVILASTRIDIAHHEHGDFDNFLLKMTHALHDTAQKLHDKRVGAPEKNILCTWVAVVSLTNSNCKNGERKALCFQSSSCR